LWSAPLLNAIRTERRGERRKNVISEKGKPTLLMIADRFPPDLGGVARSASRTAHAIARLDWNVHVLAWTKTLPPGVLETVSATESDSSTAGVTLHRLGLFSNLDFSLQHTTNVLEWLHQQHTYTAIWGHYVYPAGYMAVVFGELSGIPSTVSARGNDIDRLMFPPGDFSRLMWTLDRATVVSCVSKDLAKKVEVLLGKSIGVVVLPNSVDTETFKPNLEFDAVDLRQRRGILPNEVVLGFCGELRHKKGLPFILTAFVEVRRSRPACLLVIGEVRPRELAHLATFAAENPDAAARVVISGKLDEQAEVARHLQLCDVLLQPSVWDGLPNAVLEAMACGKIVLGSDAGGIPEAINHGVSGFIISKAQLQHLGVAIVEVLELPATEQAKLAVAARKRVQDCFHQEIEAERLRVLLGRLVEREIE
jgi:glycosyltransferase involved in cell wall biosynthesis